MKTYICRETFQIEEFDDDGFSTDYEMTVEMGAMFQRSDDPFRIIGGEVHLEGEGTWLEISKERLNEYFEEVDT